MKNRTASIKVILTFACIFALGIAVSGGFGRFVDSLSSTAQANPGQHCHVSDLRGKWAYSYHGELTGIGQLTGVGIENFDNNGHSFGTDTFAVDGSGASLTFTGDFTLGPDCKGSAVLYFSDNTTSHVELVMLDDGKEVDFIAVDPGVTLLGIAKRR